MLSLLRREVFYKLYNLFKKKKYIYKNLHDTLCNRIYEVLKTHDLYKKFAQDNSIKFFENIINKIEQNNLTNNELSDIINLLKTHDYCKYQQLDKSNLLDTLKYILRTSYDQYKSYYFNYNFSCLYYNTKLIDFKIMCNSGKSDDKFVNGYHYKYYDYDTLFILQDIYFYKGINGNPKDLFDIITNHNYIWFSTLDVGLVYSQTNLLCVSRTATIEEPLKLFNIMNPFNIEKLIYKLQLLSDSDKKKLYDNILIEVKKHYKLINSLFTDINEKTNNINYNKVIESLINLIKYTTGYQVNEIEFDLNPIINMSKNYVSGSYIGSIPVNSPIGEYTIGSGVNDMKRTSNNISDIIFAILIDKLINSSQQIVDGYYCDDVYVASSNNSYLHKEICLFHMDKCYYNEANICIDTTIYKLAYITKDYIYNIKRDYLLIESQIQQKGGSIFDTIFKSMKSLYEKLSDYNKEIIINFINYTIASNDLPNNNYEDVSEIKKSIQSENMKNKYIKYKNKYLSIKN